VSIKVAKAASKSGTSPWKSESLMAMSFVLRRDTADVVMLPNLARIASKEALAGDGHHDGTVGSCCAGGALRTSLAPKGAVMCAS